MCRGSVEVTAGTKIFRNYSSNHLKYQLFWLCLVSYKCIVYCSWNSDSLQARRFRVQTLAGTRFSTPVQTGPGVHTASCTRNTRSLSWEKSSHGVVVITTPNSCQGWRMGGAILAPPPMPSRLVARVCIIQLQSVFYSHVLHSLSLLSLTAVTILHLNEVLFNLKASLWWLMECSCDYDTNSFKLLTDRNHGSETHSGHRW